MEPNSGKSNEFSSSISCNLSGVEPAMTLTLLDSTRLEYNLKCAICLVRLMLYFNKKNNEKLQTFSLYFQKITMKLCDSSVFICIYLFT